MTFRAIWTPPGHFAPSHADYDHEPDARLAALEVSRALGVYVEVVEVP